MPEKIFFFCYLVTVVVRFLYIHISTVTLKDNNISHCVKKNVFVNDSVLPLALSLSLYQVSPLGTYTLIF